MDDKTGTGSDLEDQVVKETLSNRVTSLLSNRYTVPVLWGVTSLIGAYNAYNNIQEGNEGYALLWGSCALGNAFASGISYGRTRER